jgi:hypothetical protein
MKHDLRVVHVAAKVTRIYYSFGDILIAKGRSIGMMVSVSIEMSVPVYIGMGMSVYNN